MIEHDRDTARPDEDGDAVPMDQRAGMTYLELPAAVQHHRERLERHPSRKACSMWSKFSDVMSGLEMLGTPLSYRVPA